MVQTDPAQNLIVIRFIGRIGIQEAEQYFSKARAALPNMQPGFRLLVDLTELKGMEISVAPHIERTMDIFNEHGIAMVVRVIPNPAHDIGLQIMSLFHYGHDVRIVTCSTLDEAMTALQN